jgi:hypothetical protein
MMQISVVQEEDYPVSQCTSDILWEQLLELPQAAGILSSGSMIPTKLRIFDSPRK